MNDGLKGGMLFLLTILLAALLFIERRAARDAETRGDALLNELRQVNENLDQLQAMEPPGLREKARRQGDGSQRHGAEILVLEKGGLALCGEDSLAVCY